MEKSKILSGDAKKYLEKQMKDTKQEKRQTKEGIVEVTTLFDSDLAEYEWMQEQEAKAAKEKAEAK